jgi:hypothetical protein
MNNLTILLALLIAIDFVFTAPQSSEDQFTSGIQAIVNGSTNLDKDGGQQLAQGIVNTVLGSLFFGQKYSG